MEQLRNEKHPGINSNGMKLWGMLFLVAGIIGRGLLQNRLLGVGSLSAQKLLELMEQSDSVMTLTTVSLVLQAVETCALPIFAFLLVEGFRHTSDWKKFMLRVTVSALISEIPFNLAMSGKLIDLSSRNPAIGLALALVLLVFFQQFSEKKGYCVVAAVAALAWALMLRVDHGIALILLVVILWLFWQKTMVRTVAGVSVMALCGAGYFFYMAAPMSFLALHFYNGEKGGNTRWISYLGYPAILLIAGLVGIFLM